MLVSVFNALTIPSIGKSLVLSFFAITLIDYSYFKKILYSVSSAPFYTNFIQLPTGELVPPKIHQNPKFWPYFCNTISAIDGSHIPVVPPSHLRGQFRNRKGYLSQNALFVCDFDMKFTYTLTGWEGSATDSRVYNDAISSDLYIPQANTSWPMLAIPFIHSFLLHIVMFAIILPNGREQIKGMFVRFQFSHLILINHCFQAQEQRRALQSSPCISPQRYRTDFWCAQTPFPHSPSSHRV
jgi:hypothetical protein